ncbi:MAG: hypothetical protein OEM97_10670 [Acidimicrobiia bacterium]|nr:hypothetical protein [Acidimicrobiia bacterium]
MHGRRLGQLFLAAVLVFAVAAPAAAGGRDHERKADTTFGSFVTLAGGEGLGYTITGRAMMWRTHRHGGTTVVKVHVRGLDATTEYPTHVHNAPCSTDPAGGTHYQHTVGGPVDAVNEIWPTVTTNAAGNGHGSARHDNWARPDAMSIVIHNPADTSIRLACADLN